MKKLLYILQIPAVIIGFIVGTVFVGVQVGYMLAVDFWTGMAE